MGYNAQKIAVASICGDAAHPELRGSVTFSPHCRGVLVRAKISGLPETESGFFALHIHEGPDCRGDGFPATGGHYNPRGKAHPSHAGDLPPLLSCGGKAWLCVVTDRFRIPDVIGRTVVIHNRADDFHTQPAGNAGEKIACGVICLK